MIASAVLGSLILTVVAIGAGLIWMRDSAYRRRLNYNPRQSYVLGMAGAEVETVPVRCGQDGFDLPETVHSAVSGLLEVEVRATLAGKLSEPAVEIRAHDFCDVQYLERGAQGARFLNVSRLLASKVVPGERVSLRGRGVALNGESARLHLSQEGISKDDRVLVVAPHPDDAEIAAFGLYADTRAIVVTLTAGEASDRFQNRAQPWASLSRDVIAKIRVWDSLTIPQFGDVPIERAINLCFPDGRLGEMHHDPERDFRHTGDTELDFVGLRQLNRSPYAPKDGVCTWRSLVSELGMIMASTRPTIVVVPHPQLDPHVDHLFAAVAVSEALESVGSATGRMFLYTTHNRRSELWPFGPAGSGVALLPILSEDGVCECGFYSHALSIDRQRQKFVALEAMHDLRELQWPGCSPYQQARRRIAAELRALVHGMGIEPTCYLRRAVRPDELFFVTSFEDGVALARRVMEGRPLNVAAA